VTGWHEGRLGVFDLETTAPEPQDARIVTCCLGAVGGGQPPAVGQQIVNPGVEIPQGAIDIHGISNERAQAEGIEPAVAVQEAADTIRAFWAAGMPLIAFNASYDLTVLDRESRRHLGRPFEVAGFVLDPFVMDRQVDKYRKGKRTLEVTCQHYGVRLDGAHDATEDALAAGRVAWAIARRYPQIAAMSLGELHDAQVGWHRERQEDFRHYLIRSGKPADDVSADWPMRPYVNAVVAAEVSA
jgi:DNA polymerase-3 subunit epsilon